MPSVTGRVDTHSIDKDWHKFTVKGIELKSKFEDTYGGLDEGMTVTAEYSETQTQGQNGRKYTNRFLGKWSEVEPKDTHTDMGVTTSEGVDWDAKDRAVYMESAYKSAATFLGGVEGKDELVILARFIYSDILRAKNGETFKPIAKRGTGTTPVQVPPWEPDPDDELPF